MVPSGRRRANNQLFKEVLVFLLYRDWRREAVFFLRGVIVLEPAASSGVEPHDGPQAVEETSLHLGLEHHEIDVHLKREKLQGNTQVRIS